LLNEKVTFGLMDRSHVVHTRLHLVIKGGVFDGMNAIVDSCSAEDAVPLEVVMSIFDLAEIDD